MHEAMKAKWTNAMLTINQRLKLYIECILRLMR